MKTYSTYEAKAKFSEILRQGGADAKLARRLDRLVDRGVLVRPSERTGELGAVRRRPGALERFLRDRND